MISADFSFYAVITLPILLGVYGLLAQRFGKEPDESDDA
jgi:hypothetical protein